MLYRQRVTWLLWVKHLNRGEAVALVKEIDTSVTARLSLVALTQNGRGKYSLMLAGEYNADELRSLLSEKKLVADEDTRKGICIIREP